MRRKERESWIPDEWLYTGVDPGELEEHVIEHNRWDLEDLQEMTGLIPPYAAAREELADFTPTGAPAMNDTFWTLFKADPRALDDKKIKPSHLINRVVNEQLRELDEVDKLRMFSVGDDVQAALSASTLGHDIKTIFDRLQQQQKDAQELQNILQALNLARQEQDDAERDLDEMVRRWSGESDQDEQGQDGSDESGQGSGQDEAEGQGQGDGQDGEGQGSGEGDGQDGQSSASGGGSGGGSASGPVPTDEQMEAARQRAEAAKEKVEELQEQAQGAAGAIEEVLEDTVPELQVELKEAVGKVADELQDLQNTARAWGLDPGELQRLPAKERMELAKKLNNEKVRRAAQLFGPMYNEMLSEQVRKTTTTHEEIFDVELGDDLDRIVEDELQALGHPATRLDFYRRYVDGELMQFAMTGEERLARGGIIYCEDGSGSMSGERELWAKAFMLCLLHCARKQKRTFHLIHFGGPGATRHIGFTQPSDFTLDRILEAAEIFYGGGTDFETPMKEALGILQAEHANTGGVNADVVFVTDDECNVSERFMTEYLGEMHRMQSTTWGISVTQNTPRADGALATMCEGKVAKVRDFLTGGDVRQIFRGV